LALNAHQLGEALVTDKKKPFSIVASPDSDSIELEATQESSTHIPPEEDEIDIKTPIERMLKKELKSDRFVLAFYDEKGDIGFYTGEGMGGEEISFITDVLKARVMLQLLLE
jgi:hypothetical protein